MSQNNRALIAQQTITTHSGPLPTPEALGQYNEVLPGLADRIVAMAEGQSAHRQRLESRVVWFDGIRSTFGPIFGLIIALGGIAAGTYLIVHGYSAVGLASLLVPLGTIVAAFIYQKAKESDQSKNEG